ncbi:MAG TPA: ASKHA domain-containing protein [Selenomonadales bacterium]|nr:ASKHA domain-containing protein [Selenomonadales bacterium]
MAEQHEIIFLPGGQRSVVPAGTKLLEAARACGASIEAPCDGRGTCGKCRVKAGAGLKPADEIERDRLGPALDEGYRLACRSEICGPVRAEIPASRTATFVALTGGRGREWPFDPPVRQVAGQRSADTDQSALAQGATPLFAENYPAMLEELAGEYKKGLKQYRKVVKNHQVLDWRFAADRPCCGVALDIGTTSVVAELFDLTDGRSLGTRSCLNPQTEFGGDVLTRISFASQSADGTTLLQKKIVDGVNGLLAELAAAAGICSGDVYEVVVAGNTTMQHLLLGVNPRSLAHAPYRPVFTEQLEINPARLGLNIAPRGVVTLLPSAAAFVGADIVAGVLATGLYGYEKTALFIDIGTNGELVVAKGGALAGTSSAAGPALEGMNIACGCRAEQGAVEGFAVLADGVVEVKVIGGCAPRGLCGSGLIDAVAELVRCGVIGASGRFAKREKLPSGLAARLTEHNGQQVFMIDEAGPVYLSQKDIRQVQLAKGAIAAAVDLLLQELAVSYAELDEVLVAGAFGFHLKPSSLVGIGLLPELCRDKIRFVGNTAQEGAKAVLLNRRAAAEVRKIGHRLAIKELSLHPRFQDCFVKCLAFPEQ